MHRRLGAALARTALLIPALVTTTVAQPRTPDSDAFHVRELVLAVDNAMKGEFTAPAEWLDVQFHFLRAASGQVYVPFTVAVQDLPAGSLQSVLMYVRVAKRGEKTTASDYARRSLGPEPGVGLPVFSYDAAAAASAQLRAMDWAKQRGPYLFQAAHAATIAWSGGTGSLRRAFEVAPGTYDVYVALRERSPEAGRTPRAGVLKRVVEVPDFAGAGLAVTPPLLAADITAVTSKLAPDEQAVRPYALGTFEIVPHASGVYRQSETLTVLVFVYNAGTDLRGKPAVVVEYRFHELLSDGALRPYARPVRQRYDERTLPAQFDLRAGHELAPVQEVPLSAFPAGRYRVEVLALDERMSSRASASATFEVR